MIESLLIKSLTAYAITFVIASSSIFAYFRLWLKSKTPRFAILDYPHFIDCRQCVGFWVSLAVCNTDWEMILPVYALSYFLATQER